ncbi:MAG: hypothetical protein HYR96_08645 [Deltaproteobacteria bacterium]|nr:hypothetical protein [Deltaproteobacteria bacterium]MBI3294679.1 hypothetical protein [Deltaproteobacteria bacterium]
MPKITSVATPEFAKLIVESSDGARYHSDLSALKSVRNFPKDSREWGRVKIDSYGISLVWSSQLQLNLAQIIARSTKEDSLDTAVLKSK